MLVKFKTQYRGGYGSFEIGQIADVPQLFGESLIENREGTQVDAAGNEALNLEPVEPSTPTVPAPTVPPKPPTPPKPTRPTPPTNSAS